MFSVLFRGVEVVLAALALAVFPQIQPLLVTIKTTAKTRNVNINN